MSNHHDDDAPETGTFPLTPAIALLFENLPGVAPDGTITVTPPILEELQREYGVRAEGE